MTLLLAFYGLGLMLGQAEVERGTLATPSPVSSGRSKASARDPRSELDFINAVPSKDEATPGVGDKPPLAGETGVVRPAGDTAR